MKVLFFLMVTAFMLCGETSSQTCRANGTRYNTYVPKSYIPNAFFGPTMGMEMVSSHSHYITPRTPDICDCELSGGGLGYFGGISVEYVPGENPRNSSYSIMFHLGFRSLPITIAQEIDNQEYISDIIENADQLSDKVMYYQDHDIDLVSFSVTGKSYFLAGTGIAFELGIDIGRYLKKSVKEEIEILDGNESIKFKEELEEVEYILDKSISLYDGEIKYANKTSFGIIFGLTYDFYAGETLFIAPTIRFNFPITNIVNDLNASSLQYSINFKWAF
jgi:hypothetical protein